MVLVEDAFGKYLGYEDETLINEIVPFNRCSRKIHGPFHHVKTQQKTGYEPERGHSPCCDFISALCLDFPTSRNVRDFCLL